MNGLRNKNNLIIVAHVARELGKRVAGKWVPLAMITFQ